MIKRIILSITFVCLLFAISLSMYGVTHVELGSEFMGFMNNVNRQLQNWKIEIPQIPQIDYLGGSEWYDFLFRTTIGFLNGCVSLINVSITIFNVIIQVIQFTLTCLYSFISMRDRIIAQS